MKNLINLIPSEYKTRLKNMSVYSLTIKDNLLTIESKDRISDEWARFLCKSLEDQGFEIDRIYKKFEF